MKHFVLSLLLIGCVDCSGSAPPLYDRSQCTDVNLSCHYERDWEHAQSFDTRWIGEEYQCVAPITLVENDCIEGNTNDGMTLWCCAPPNMWSGMP